MYLGLPQFWGRSRAHVLRFIVDRMRSKAQGWKEKLLSAAGKEVLVKSVLQALPAYSMTVFKFPVEVVRKLEEIIRKFWWGADMGEWKVHWVAWHKMTTSKQNGGMGLRDLSLFNRALIAKTAWRIAQQPQALWVQILRGLYFHSGNFLGCQVKKVGSWVWMSILWERDALLSGLRWNVGNGTNIPIWGSPWVPTLPKFVVFTPKKSEDDVINVSDLFCSNIAT